MNFAAVIFGVFYGALSAGIFYLVSSLTSGLFARPLYRLFTRVLISMCCVMLVAPAIRWLSDSFPASGVWGLWLAQYAAVGILMAGVLNFNRTCLPAIVGKRARSVYFTFGAWANACVVTLAFLQIAVSGAPTWSMLGSERAYLTAGHYGPLVMLLAAMIFHTDYRLKVCNRQPIGFSRFTFLGYFIAFFGLALAMLPYAGRALTELGFTDREWALLQNASSAESLMIAILLFAWLVWKYESIPPLFALLGSIIFEYHVLVTQWVVEHFGMLSWGLASLPLFIIMGGLNHYFSTWDRRKRASKIGAGSSARSQSQELVASDLRFVIPFTVIDWLLGCTLVVLTLWQRLAVQQTHAAEWTALTFAVYAIYFYSRAWFSKKPLFVYSANGLALAAALFGAREVGSPISTMSIGILGFLWALVALVSDRLSVDRKWRASMADGALLVSVLALSLVLPRHFLSSQPYYFSQVGWLDAIALLAALGAFLVCAHQYRSSLPVFGALVALATIAPTQSAWFSLLVVIILSALRGRLPKDNPITFDDRLQFLNRYSLPGIRRLPELFVEALSNGAVPLAVLGFAVSMSHVARGNISLLVLSGATASSVAMGLLTRTNRSLWLYMLSIVAAFTTVQAAAFQWISAEWSWNKTLGLHLLLSVILVWIGWLVARLHARWCYVLLQRVAEDREPEIEARGFYYSGLLQKVSVSVGLFNFGAILWMLVSHREPTQLLLVSSGLLGLYFSAVAHAYRTQVASYLALASLAMFLVTMVPLANLSWLSEAVAFGTLGLLAAAFSALRRRVVEKEARVVKDALLFDQSPPTFLKLLPAEGLSLWLRPSAVAAVICSLLAVAALPQWTNGLLRVPTPSVANNISLTLSSLALLISTRSFRIKFSYLFGLLLGGIAIHAWLQLSVLSGQPSADDLPAHLALAATLCLGATLAGSLWAGNFNRRLRMRSRIGSSSHLPDGTTPYSLSRIDVEDPLGKRNVPFKNLVCSADSSDAEMIVGSREFYAGLLQHVQLAVGVMILSVMIFNWRMILGSEPIEGELLVAASFLLAVAFACSGAVYRSSIQSYLALVAVVAACYYAIGSWAPVASQKIMQDALQPCLAILFGVVAWWIGKPARPELERNWDADWPWPQCWTRPPLPFVLVAKSLWSKPLAKASIILALLCIYSNAVVWKTVAIAPTSAWLLMSAGTLLIATFTYRLSVFGWLELKRGGHDLTADQFERGLLLVASLATLGFTAHFVLQRHFFGDVSQSAMMGWHMLLESTLALSLWVLATLLAWGLRQRLEDSEQAQDSRSQLGADVYVYIVLPLQVAGVIGILVPILAVYGSLFLFASSVPLVIASLVSATLLGLLSGSFRIQLGSYLSLASVGVAFVLLSKYLFSADWPIFMWGPVALNANSVLLMSIASLFSGFTSRQGQPAVPLLPTEWRLPAPMRRICWSEIWVAPVRDVGLVCLILALVFSMSNIASAPDLTRYSIPLLANCVLAAISLLLAVKVYQSAWPMYLSLFMWALSIIPLLLALTRPVTDTSLAWAFLAATLWLISFAIERSVASRLGTVDVDLMPIRIYERPIFRSSAVLAVLSVISSLVIYVVSNFSLPVISLVVSCVMGAVTLILCARSANIIRREILARLLVYSACAAIVGCVLVLAWSSAGFGKTILALAVLALLMTVFGFFLLKVYGSRFDVDSPMQTWLRLFGEPLSNSGLWLSLSVMSLAIPRLAFSWLDQSGYAKLDVSAAVDYIHVSMTLLLISASCLIGVRSVRRAIWLHPAVVAGTLGIWVWSISSLDFDERLLSLAGLLVANCSVAFASYLKRNDQKSEMLFGVSGDYSEWAFFLWSAIAVGLLFLLQSTQTVFLFWTGAATSAAWPGMLASLLTTSFFYQALYREPRVWWLNTLFVSMGFGVSSAAVFYGGAFLPIDVWIAVLGFIWGGLAFRLQVKSNVGELLHLPGLPAFRVSEKLAAATTDASFAASTIALLISLPAALHLHVAWPSMAITCLIVAAGFTISSWRSEQLGMATAAMLLLPFGLGYGLYHVMEVHFFMTLETMPSFAGSMLLVVGFVYSFIAGPVLKRNPEAASFVNRYSMRLQAVATALVTLSAITAVYAVIELEWTLLPASVLALVGIWWFGRAFASNSERCVYIGLAAIVASVAMIMHGYLKIPFFANPILAFAAIGISFSLFGINVLAGRSSPESRFQVLIRPSFYVAVFVPSSLLFTVPYGHRDVAAYCLLSAAAFYLIVSQARHLTWALYVAILAANAAIYLWLPEIHQTTGLFQLYVIPAAFSVLFFAQLHRKEVNHQVLSSIRYAAAGAILATSTLEIFVDEGSSLLQFIMVLGLSLMGTAAGIALRVRPFVFVGLAFLTLNVIAQLGLQFQREGGIIRAVILIGVGILVLAAMIFFNIHRERILKQYHRFMADVQWE